MRIQFITFLAYCLLVTGCKSESRPPDLSFEVYTVRSSRYEVVALVEKFALREKLIQSKNYRIPTPEEDRVSINFADAAQKNAWMWVSNGNLKNQDHVEVSIFRLSKDEACDICKKFEASDEMKAIKEKFEIQNVVKNGNW